MDGKGTFFRNGIKVDSLSLSLSLDFIMTHAVRGCGGGAKKQTGSGYDLVSDWER